jgi:3-oxoacyl-[acyl-carrier protein] reductase
MDLDLTGKVAIVTGASRGIGHAIARRLAEKGMTVTVAARSEDLLRRLTGDIQSAGRQARAHPGDLRDPAACSALVADTISQFGRLDLLVNNAGATKRGDFLAFTDDDWADGFALKFYAAVRLSRAAWPHLRAAGGCIINIAGVGGRTGSAEFTIGGSVNAAMLNLTKSLADRGVADGVRVNAINPGSILTDRLAARVQRRAAESNLSPDEAARQMTREMGVSRFGHPSEIAAAVAFLASPAASYVQGAVIDIDGGLTRTL